MRAFRKICWNLIAQNTGHAPATFLRNQQRHQCPKHQALAAKNVHAAYTAAGPASHLLTSKTAHVGEQPFSERHQELTEAPDKKCVVQVDLLKKRKPEEQQASLPDQEFLVGVLALPMALGKPLVPQLLEQLGDLKGLLLSQPSKA